MVVHEIGQNPDGTLRVVPPETVRNAMSKELPLEFEALTGRWQNCEGSYHTDTPHAYACALLSILPECYRIEADVTFTQRPLEYGIALQMDRDFVKGYYLQWESARQRVQWKSAIRMYEDGGATFPYEVEMEHAVSIKAGVPTHVTILAQESLIVVYLNGQTAMTVRGFDYTARRLGLYAFGGSVQFDHVKLYTME